MPRQNFLSSDFFVSASEWEAKQAVESIPAHLSNIKLLKSNPLTQSMRFLYEHPDKLLHNYMDVSILKLDEQYIRFSLHASYTNGQAFYTDPQISYALYQFEQAVHAAIKKDFASLQQSEKPQKKQTSYLLNAFTSIADILLLWKKLI